MLKTQDFLNKNDRFKEYRMTGWEKGKKLSGDDSWQIGEEQSSE